MAFLHQRFRVPHEPGQQTHRGLDHRQCRDFATVQHIVPDAYLQNAVRRAIVLHHPLVDPLVSPTRKNQVGCL